MITEEEKSEMMSTYHQKGDPRACGVYSGINSLEHLIKILERVLEQQLRDITEVDSMHFAFSKGKGTTDTVFFGEAAASETSPREVCSSLL